ncbi:MAG: winged helix-turn-helix transcriptional regulator [Candidatus Lokiarchaeota archaeon]|nr:winged helix-turn-helix transcriptional regulator [Candidatus Lokiarchaeota archaeon]
MKSERKNEIINSLKMCVDLKNDDLEVYFNDLRQDGSYITSSENIKEMANLFSVLGNDLRLSILKILNQKDRCVCELEAMLDKSQPSISHHLKLLEKAGLIRGVKKGYFTHYEPIKSKLERFFRLINKEFPPNNIDKF